MSPAPFISTDNGREMAEKHYRHHSSVIITAIIDLFLVLRHSLLLCLVYTHTHLTALFPGLPG